MANSRSRITQLDGVRALAIAAVFIHHSFGVKLLWMGVDLFFVLSGFLITGILVNEKDKPFSQYIGGFYLRRAKRILPAYVVILLIAVGVYGPSWLRYWYLYIGGMNFLTALGLPSPETLPLWSLAVEEQFYLLWPLAVFFLDRKALIRCSIALLALAPILRFVCTPMFDQHWAVYTLLPFRMDTLAAGALIALLWPELLERLESASQRHRLRRTIAGVSLLAGLGAIVSLRFLSKHGHTTASNTPLGNSGVLEAALVLVTAVFLVSLIGFGKRFLSIWPMMWIGRISYSIYLFHVTAIYLVRLKFPSLAGPYQLALIVIVTIGYAVAMWYLVEKPINSIGHVRLKVLITQT
jgi:peptidoglycan/LPS O-acetylase OafA/YrhL